MPEDKSRLGTAIEWLDTGVGIETHEAYEPAERFNRDARNFLASIKLVFGEIVKRQRSISDPNTGKKQKDRYVGWIDYHKSEIGTPEEWKLFQESFQAKLDLQPEKIKAELSNEWKELREQLNEIFRNRD